jgi:hypothetical protein
MLYGALINLPGSKGLLKIAAKDWGAGIVSVCLFTKEGVLLSQRAVLVEETKAINAVMQIDSSTHKPLAKTKVKVILRDEKGNPVKGLFSFSCALEQTITFGAGNIEHFNLYDRFLPEPSLLAPWSYLKQTANIEGALLRLPANGSKNDYPVVEKSKQTFDGYVLQNGSKPKKPVELMIAGPEMQLFKTDADGRFVIPYLPPRGEFGTKALISVVSNNPYAYKLIIESSLKNTNDTLATRYHLLNHFTNDELLAEQKQKLGSSRAIVLKEVEIKAKAVGIRNYYGKINETGSCNDYVCVIGFLNCRDHPSGTPGTKKAVDGETYAIEGNTRPELIVYHCQYKAKPLYIQAVSLTENSSQFYPFSPTDPNLPDALNSTTLHWQAFIYTDERGEASISFYNNARSGRFKAVVQGVTANGVFSSEVYFEVKQ